MSLLQIVKSIFSSNKKDLESQRTAQESMEQIRSRMDILNQKAFNLKDNYPEEKNQIAELFELVNTIEPSPSVRAGKFEWALGQAITRVSSACDKVFTSLNKDELDAEIALLSKAVRERQNADMEEDDE
ncbi:MAG: hypothetical protein MJ169_03470 [Treponema sp.]|nr:hypothetical protein [Treponema sp.]